VTKGSEQVLEQITKHLNRLIDVVKVDQAIKMLGDLHLNRLIDVVKVVDLTEGAHVERELMLIKVRAAGKEREEVKRMTDIFRGRIIDVTDTTYTIELTGTQEKIEAFIKALDHSCIL